MSLLAFDLSQLYARTFGGRPFVINGQNEKLEGSSTLVTQYLNKEIWLPVLFTGLSTSDFPAGGMVVRPGELLLPYTTVKISSKKNIVKTPLAERKGSVRELFSTDDYQIALKGFLIDEQNRRWPDKEINLLRKLYDENQALTLDNALTNIFLDDRRVVIEAFDMPEVEGGRNHIRPFSLTLESDSIFTLEVAANV